MKNSIFKYSLDLPPTKSEQELNLACEFLALFSCSMNEIPFEVFTGRPCYFTMFESMTEEVEA